MAPKWRVQTRAFWTSVIVMASGGMGPDHLYRKTPPWGCAFWACEGRSPSSRSRTIANVAGRRHLGKAKTTKHAGEGFPTKVISRTMLSPPSEEAKKLGASQR